MVSPPTPVIASATGRNPAVRAPVSTDITRVIVFDAENKCVAHSSSFTSDVRDVFCQWGQIFVLTTDGKVGFQEEEYIYICTPLIYHILKAIKFAGKTHL
jgi:hypothetical protein